MDMDGLGIMPITYLILFYEENGGLWFRNRILLFDSFYSYGEHETSRGMCLLSLSLFTWLFFFSFSVLGLT